jgi:SAM-dependent methyltransferase
MPTWTADAADYERNAGFVPRLADPLLELAGDLAGRRVLDLGCGDGTLTVRLVEAGAVVVAVDADPSMVRATRARGIDARVADARSLDGVDGPFDIVLSNAVLHWIPEPTRVARAVARVLRPGGVFVAEAGGHGNVAAVRVALAAALRATGHRGVATPDWWFPTMGQQQAVLTDAGFAVDVLDLVPRPVALESGIDAWLRTFCGAVLDQVGPDGDAVLAATTALLDPVLRAPDGTWTADYVRIRFRASAG